MAVVAVFRGDAAETHDLVEAIAHNCACEQPKVCGAHMALMDQRWLDGILFARFLVDVLLFQEFEVAT